MRPTPGDLICGQVRVVDEADPDLGGHTFGPPLRARLTEDRVDAWLTVVERKLVPSQVELSTFMAGASALLTMSHPALVPVVLVDREADFFVIGYQDVPGAIPLSRRLEGSGSTAGLVDRVAVELARSLAFLHRQGRVHGALSPGNVALCEGGVVLWQYGLAELCPAASIAPRFRSLGGDVVAPEVRGGEAVGVRADVYAWGAIIASLATDCLGSEAVAAVEAGQLDAGPLTPIVVAALSSDPGARPLDGIDLLRRIQDGEPADSSLVNPSSLAKQAELRELARRYLDEAEGRSPADQGSRSSARGGAKRRPRVFKRVAKEAYQPELAPIAGVMIAPDEPEPDPFTLPPGDVAPPEVEEEEVVPPPPRPAAEPTHITARRIEDEPAKRFNPDALTPPDGAVLSDLAPAPETTTNVVLPPLTAPGVDAPAAVAPPTALGRIETRRIEAPQSAAAAMIPPPPERPPSAPSSSSSPPPSMGSLEPADSGFGLSLPVAELIDGSADPLSDVVGALAVAESSPHLAMLDGQRAEPNPTVAGSGGPAIPLAEPPRPQPAAPSPSPAAVVAPRPAASLPPAPGGGPGALSGLELDLAPGRPPPSRASSSGLGSASSSASRPVPATAPPPAVAAPVVGVGDGSRGPRGSAMAAVIGFGATLLAVGLTVPVAQQRGGLSVLLGMAERTSAAEQTPTAATPPDVPPEPDQAPPVAAETKCPTDTVPVATTPKKPTPKRPGVCIETGEYPGVRQIPTTQVTFAEAAEACEAGGRRLCTAKEWKRACRGDGRRLPYAGSRTEGRCNDARTDGVGQNLSRSGAREECVTPEGVYDLVGNVGEWVADGSVMGGDATTSRASCTSRKKPKSGYNGAATGFRCCVTLDTELPAEP